MSHVTYAEEIHALETILARVRQEKAEVEKERDALAAYGEQLREALMEVAPGVPPVNASCHVGIVPQAKCRHCQTAIKAREALAETPATSLARLEAQWQAEALEKAVREVEQEPDLVRKGLIMAAMIQQLRRQAEGGNDAE